MTILASTSPSEGTARAFEAFRHTYSAPTVSSAMKAAIALLVGDVATDQSRLEMALGRLGARVEVGSIPEAATLAVKDGQYVIRIRSSDSHSRRRFSIAHEIGHVLLFEGVASEPDLVATVAHRLGNSMVERLCDEAAAELLMPAESFRESLLSARFDWDQVMQLAKQYQASPAAVLVRVVDVLVGARIVRFQRDPLTMGRSRQYERLSTYGREPLNLPRRLRSGELRPRVLDAADDRGRGVSRRMQLVIRGNVVWQTQCIAIRERFGSVSMPEAVGANRDRSPAVIAVLLQPEGIEADAWRVLSAR